ncbi:spindle assembly checkpoint component MAD1 [Scheffersomyces xylosifermentans]|uniref:spindle assembly checkpoint component MAD1 n=1 Tax=Scheffersomyces xylosifermentans TaxID=1304137 RepID=UPI00315D2500
MSSTTSSPFLEHPKSEYSNHGETSIRYTEDTELNYKQTISKLQFQLASTRTEKDLLEQQKQSIISTYEDALLKKSEELHQLQASFEYLYEDKKQLDSKVDNQSQINLTSIKGLNESIDRLTKENYNINNKYNDLEAKNSRLNRKYEQVRSDLNFQLSANDQLNTEISNLKSIILNLEGTNDDLVKELNNYSTRFNDDTSLNKLIEGLQVKNSSLQNINNQLQLKIDSLLQNKTSNELLKSKNTSLLNKIQYLEGIEEKYCKLEVEKIELENRFNDFFKILNESIKDETDVDDDSTSETKVKSFIETFKQLQYKYLVFKDKYDESQSSVNELVAEIQSLKNHQQETLIPQIDSLKSKLRDQSDSIAKHERQKLLNLKEIEFLRKSLKEMDEINVKRGKDESQNNKSTDQYLTNLEKLVDDYRNELNSLQKQLQQFQQGAQIGDKRRKTSTINAADSSLHDKLSKLQKENLVLLTKVKEKEDAVANLQSKLSDVQKLNSKKDQLQVLQLKSNLIAKDQIVKSQTLEALRKENEDLIQKYIKNLDGKDLIPKSIFERQEDDKTILQTKIDQLTNRNIRLREIYAKKSKDILTIISKYFGYSIEFLPSPLNPNDLSARIKLTSRYLNKDSKNYMVIDVEAKSLKAYGDHEFKLLCEELSSTWVKGKDQIPCLLSALNLSIYESQSRKTSV